MERVKLKGGSLSGTYKCVEGGNTFIRKEVSLVENREFGFYRWFSQLKKLQRLGKLFPGIFPKVINIGIEKDTAYFDLEFIPNSMSVYEYLRTNPGDDGVEKVFKKIIETTDTLYSAKIESFKGGFDLYIDQEVKRALEFCMDDPEFKEFAGNKTIIFNGKEIPSLLSRMDEFYELAHKHYKKPEECFTHGNITLENILYAPAAGKIILIDLYEENFVDTVYNEYSQILQSCNSYYEVYNELNPVVSGNKVTIETERYPGIDYFNELFDDFLKKRFSEDEIIVTKLYEISQFTRMLPFKKYVAKNKMMFFYSLASKLFDDIK